MHVVRVQESEKRYQGTEHEYERKYDYWTETHTFSDNKERIEIRNDKATNPPTIYYLWSEYLSLPLYCEDGFYLCPASLLQPGVKSLVQHRTLISVGFRP